MRNFRKKSDSELAELTMKGSSEAFGELVVRYQNLVWSAVNSVISNYEIVEDIAQETFIDAYTRLPSLREKEKFASWIYGIAKRKALNYVSRRRTYTDIDEIIEFLTSESPTPEENILESEKITAVRNAVNSLSEKNREAVELFYFRNLSIEQISAKTGTSQTAIKSRLHEARIKLKGALSYMMEDRNTQTTKISPDFNKKVMEIMENLKVYTGLYGYGSEEYNNYIRETEKSLLNMPECAEKNRILLDFYSNTYNDEKFYEISEKNAPGDYKAMKACSEMWDKNDGDTIDLITKALEDDELRGSYKAFELYFWRGVAYTRNNNPKAARADFTKAEAGFREGDIYKTLAKTSLRAMDLLRENADNDCAYLSCCAEGYVKHNNGTYFFSQPGFNNSDKNKHSYSLLYYYLSGCDQIIINSDIKAGEKYTSRDGSCTYAVVGDNETAETPAGTFTGCVKITISIQSGIHGIYMAEVWFKENVGLVRAEFKDDNTSETYELEEYRINGGEGYFPFAKGNRWKYVNPAIPDYLYTCFEYEIDWTDGKSCNAIAIDLVGLRKDYEKYDPDGSFYIEKCDKLCDEWKTDEAIEMLKKAVQVNTSENETITALGGIEYLTRFAEAQKKNYRICPSSCGLTHLIKKDGGITLSYTDCRNFGPYRFGTRHEENRIFGVKVFRYLDQLTGYIWNDRWTDGYSEEYTNTTGFIYDVKIKLKAEKGVRITTAAGEFENTIKLTITADAVGKEGDYYFSENYKYSSMGVREYWFARGVGIVKLDSRWNDFTAGCELTSYYCPAADDSYMPLQIGNRWEYDEVSLTGENYRAKRIIEVKSGMANRYNIFETQEFWYLGTEEEYEEFKKSLNK